MKEIHHQGHQGHQEHQEENDKEVDRFAREAVDAGLKVHRQLGPGLLESAYEPCLAHEFGSRGISIQRQVTLPVIYHSISLDAGYRLDLVVGSKVILEIEAVDAITPLHEAQLLTYLKLSGCRIGLLMNFNVRLFRDGVGRFAR